MKLCNKSLNKNNVILWVPPPPRGSLADFGDICGCLDEVDSGTQRAKASTCGAQDTPQQSFIQPDHQEGGPREPVPLAVPDCPLNIPGWTVLTVPRWSPSPSPGSPPHCPRAVPPHLPWMVHPRCPQTVPLAVPRRSPSLSLGGPFLTFPGWSPPCHAQEVPSSPSSDGPLLAIPGRSPCTVPGWSTLAVPRRSPSPSPDCPPRCPRAISLTVPG